MNGKLSPLHKVYRCADGHDMRTLGKVQPPPETLPCNHWLANKGDSCGKESKRVS
jgi:hypothetical protein